MGAAFQQPQRFLIAAHEGDWGDDQATILAIVRRYFSDFNDNGFYPHPDETALQRELRAVPTLQRLSQLIGHAEARGLAITGLGLTGLGEAQRNAILYAIALCQGFPTSTDQRTHRVAWDIRARPESGQNSRYVTFSERVGNADMHTDSSFYPMPEEQFMLYVVSAAGCNGGETLLVDVDDIHAELQRSEAGRAAFALLCATPLPFRVPSVYAASDDGVEVHLAPVFQRHDGMLAMRWRHDSIVKGLAARPQHDTPAVRAALELLNEVIEFRAPRFCQQLPDDTLLWADNRHALHGRGVYTDPARHLIRIRISDLANAERVGPSGISAD
ncbi:TauD/TfdA family dioxygenase [Duganella radicis]|nr:TauD/TfdA family dioxygenase [Duganella radicis]